MQGKSSTLFRVAGWSAYLSAVVSAVGILFVVLFYIYFLGNVYVLRPFGLLSDYCALIQNALAIPVVVALYRLLRPHSPWLILGATLVAVVGTVGTVVYQMMVVTGTVRFMEVVGYALATFLLLGVWIVTTSLVGRRSGQVQVSVATMILGALYVGFPWWAFRVGQRLLAEAGTRQ